jgi:hypothetical protein
VTVVTDRIAVSVYNYFYGVVMNRHIIYLITALFLCFFIALPYLLVMARRKKLQNVCLECETKNTSQCGICAIASEQL